jgi:hypothetical protein
LGRPARNVRHAADEPGLTFGTISATYGYTAGVVTRAQFSVLICLVVVSAVAPTALAQRLFDPHSAGALERAEELEDEDEVARPRHHLQHPPPPTVHRRLCATVGRRVARGRTRS